MNSVYHMVCRLQVTKTQLVQVQGGGIYNALNAVLLFVLCWHAVLEFGTFVRGKCLKSAWILSLKFCTNTAIKKRHLNMHSKQEGLYSQKPGLRQWTWLKLPHLKGSQNQWWWCSFIVKVSESGKGWHTIQRNFKYQNAKF